MAPKLVSGPEFSGRADLGTHYSTAIMPGRTRRSRDNPKVEVAVQMAQRWILARLRNQTFFSPGTSVLETNVDEVRGDEQKAGVPADESELMGGWAVSGAASSDCHRALNLRVESTVAGSSSRVRIWR